MIKTLAQRIRQYKLSSILAPLFMLGEVALEVTIPFVTARLIDGGVTPGDLPYITKIGGLLLLCTFASMLCGSLSGRFASVAAAGFARNLRHDMYYRIQDFAFADIDRFSTASIITRLTTDVSNLQNAYMMLLRMAVRSPGMLLFAFTASMRIHAKLSLIFLACLPVIAIGQFLIVRRAHPFFVRVFKTYDKLNAMVQENLRGIRVVKSFLREDYETKKFHGVSKQIDHDFTKAAQTIAFNMPLMQITSYACILLVSWFGARLVVASGNQATGLTTGELLCMFSYATQILISLMMLSFVFVQIVLSRASAERVTEILRQESSLKSKENGLTEVKDGSVRFVDVSFSYGKTADLPCLDHISLEIGTGETVGVIGATGSSKSTLVQLIPRLYDATAGTVEVGGADVRDYDLTALREQVAMVLQKNVLFSGTIKDNLRWGKQDATQEEMEAVCRLAQAHDFIMQFPDGYETRIEQGGTNVSGGQKQRLCIARALLKQPKILIFDDSTSAVDTATDAKIRAALRESLPQTTKIIIAQRIASVQDADMILVMDEGKILASGTHDALLQSCAVYREVFESQQKGAEDDA